LWKKLSQNLFRLVLFSHPTFTIQPQYARFSTDYKSSAEQYDQYRNIVVLVVLALPCTALVALASGAICKYGVPFTAYYWVGYFASFFVFLLFALHLPLAMVVQDTCAYMTQV
jgi:hypothetical protein